MKKLMLVAMLLAGFTSTVSASPGITMDYADVTLMGGFQANHFNHVWDLTACDMTINFTYDANGLVDDLGGDAAHAWGMFGIRQVGYSDFNPTWMTEGAGVWLATDYEWSANTFDPDPVGAPSLDIDDKMILQKGGGMGEGAYSLPSVPPNPWANHAVWFDRDGVDQWQAAMWGAIDGVTYNTGGIYDITISLNATSTTAGKAYMTINGEHQGFYVPNWHTGPADLMPAGMTFTGDMSQMQVFYGMYGYGAVHSIAFTDIQVTGCLAPIPVAIDIKPGSDPNSINLKSKGVVTVAVLTTDEFDASSIDPVTVIFAGASPLRWAWEDVDFDCDTDLVFHFKTQELNLDSNSIEALLSGYTLDSIPIEGTDLVNIVPKK